MTNPSGDTQGLIYDFHNYFDSGSGTSTDCISNKISDGFQPPVDFLRQNKRQAMVTELGGGGTNTNCLTYVCEALDFLNQNSDVYLGWTAWAAGGFPATYELALLDGGGNDVPLMTQCFAAKFRGTNGTDTVGSDPVGSDTVGNGAGTNGTGSTGTGSGTGSGTGTGTGTSTGTGTAASGSGSPFPGVGRIGSGTNAIQPGTSGYPNGFQSFKAEAPVTGSGTPATSAGNGGNSTSTTGSSGTSGTCKRKGKKAKRRRSAKARIGAANDGV